jgi:chromosomal replication initiator protein DnaA
VTNRKRLFLSYCWADKDIADYVDDYCSKQNIQIIRDIRDVEKWESIKLYMRKIRNCDYAILIITPNYLKSKNCMYEIMEIMKEINYNHRIVPLVLPASNVFNCVGKLDYIKFWKTEYEDLREKIYEIGDIEVTTVVQQELKIISDIYRNIGEFMNLISDMNCPQNVNDFCDSLINKFFLLNISDSKVNDKYTFSTFYVGNYNRFANAAALAISENIGNAYNPLFIYGKPGLGKTHLLHAIANSVVKTNPRCKVLYYHCEDFTSDLCDAIIHNKNNEFREQFLYIDMLIIDDIQFLRGKEMTQEEIYYIFNKLYESNKQIIIAANCSPRSLKLTDMIQDRFEWGLIADIVYPEIDERLEYLKWKYSYYGINDISDDALLSLVNDSEISIRQLDSAFNNYLAKNSGITGNYGAFR